MAGWTALGTALASVALGWYVVIWSICLLGWHVAHQLFHNVDAHAPTDAAEAVPGVSVLRPLAGLDSNLFTNLCSLFEQTYPADRFEVLLSVMAETDQALPIARKVAARYPHIASTILVGAPDTGVNPKINNLVRPYAQCAHDIVWVVDSQVRLSPHAMRRTVEALVRPPPNPPPGVLRGPHGARVGLVHHVPLGVLPAPTWGSHMERAFLSTTHAKMYLAINIMAIDSCVMGKSNLYRKSDLANVPDTFFAYDANEESDGGSARLDGAGDAAPLLRTTDAGARPLARFGIYLAEDNMLALSLWRKPLQLAHRVAPGDVAHVALGDIHTIAEYARRRMRWIRVRRHMVPAATYVEPFTESLVAGLCGWVGLRTLVLVPWGYTGYTWFLPFFVAHLCAWYAVDRGVLSALQQGAPLPPAERRYFLGAWCLRELLALPIWVWAMLGSSVTWRGRRYRILQDARATHMPGTRGGWLD